MPTPVKTMLRLSTGLECPQQADIVDTTAQIGHQPSLQVLRVQKLSRQHEAAAASATKRPREVNDDWLFQEDLHNSQTQNTAATVKTEHSFVVKEEEDDAPPPQQQWRAPYTTPPSDGIVVVSYDTAPTHPLHKQHDSDDCHLSSGASFWKPTAIGVDVNDATCNPVESSRERPLDKFQMLCVTHDTNGPLLIRAGAGSGKTQTISKRIAYLMERGVPPYHILGLSFSRASAEELRHRVAATLPRHRVPDAAKLKMKTIHGFCLEMLRKYHEQGGRLVLFDDKQRRNVAERAVMSMMAAANRGQAPRQIHRGAVNMLLKFVDQTKRTIPSNGARTWNALGRGGQELAAQFKKYEDILHDEEGAVDFADLQWYLFLLLTDATPRDDLQGRTVAQDIQRRFTHIIVDEVQDVDSVQYEILCRVAGDACRVSCVGDPRQAIYGFRGAVKNFFDTWKSRFSVKDEGQRELLYNYRSVSQVVEVGNVVAAGYAGNCSSTKGTGAFPVTIHYAAHVEDMNHKALNLIQSITNSSSTRGLRYSDIGIVTRKSATGRELQKFLQSHHIPCKTLRRRDPTAAVMMRGLLAHLRCIIDPYASNVDVMEALEYPEKLAKNTKTGLISGRKCRVDRLRDEMPQHVNSTATAMPHVSYFELIDELVRNQFMVPDAQLVPRSRKDKDALSRWHESVVQLHHELRRLSIPEDVLQYSSQKATHLEESVKQEADEKAVHQLMHQHNDPLKYLITKALELFGFTSTAQYNNVAIGAIVPHQSLHPPGGESVGAPSAIVEVVDDGDEDEVDPLVSSNDGLRDLLFEALDNLKATGEPHQGVAGLCALVDSLQPLDGAVSDYGPLHHHNNNNNNSSTLPSALQRQKSLQDNRLTISTVHKSKGLEWPVVFVFDCTEGEMPIVNKYDNSCNEEEKRIFYVAVSRAMEQLAIFAQESSSRMPSRFLKCLQGHVEEVRAHTAQTSHDQ